MTVLLADEIHKLCVDENGSPIDKPLIEPFHVSRLRPASYQLTLGDQAHVGGKHIQLDDRHPIVLEPHQVAVVSTSETVRIPRNIIARWSLRVTNIYEGLLWTGGPQVDPGWEGPLFCPVYNLAERTVVLKYQDPLFTMDFTRTTPVGPELEKLKEDEAYSKIWFEPVLRTLSEHDSHRLHSAPYEALRELRELRNFRTAGYVAISLILLVLTFMVAALAVVAVEPTVQPGGPYLSFWPMTALAGAFSSLVLSLGSIVVCILIWLRIRTML